MNLIVIMIKFIINIQIKIKINKISLKLIKLNIINKNKIQLTMKIKFYITINIYQKTNLIKIIKTNINIMIKFKIKFIILNIIKLITNFNKIKSLNKIKIKYKATN